jgi:hypothetical protein
MSCWKEELDSNKPDMQVVFRVVVVVVMVLLLLAV